MQSDRHESGPAAAVRTLLPWTSVLLVLALLWTGWVFLSRHRDIVEAQREAAERVARADQQTLSQLGGDRLTVLDFYASPGAIHRGTHVSLCYGVSNAVSVLIEPDLGSWKPAISRCIDIEPKRTTSYTLTAKSASGQTETATAKVIVE
ncbi:MAG: hypothetical protein ABSB67_23055 [Bryobacteraceae bacterium]|jgi:hypothetical protein